MNCLSAGRCAAALLLAAPLASAADTPRVPTLDDLLAIETVGAPRLSPDGSRVAFTRRRADLEQDAYLDQIWLARPGEPPRQLTRGAESATRPRWSPDGSWLAFLRRDGERRQLQLIRSDAGEAFPITNRETDVEDFEWSPDGARIAFRAAEPEREALKRRERQMGRFQVVRREYRHSHLWLLEVAAALEAPAAGAALTRGGDFHVRDFAWSPGASRIAFTASSDPDLVNGHTTDLYLVEVEGGAVRRLVDTPSPEAEPLWSPDGRSILFSTFLGREVLNRSRFAAESFGSRWQ